MRHVDETFEEFARHFVGVVRADADVEHPELLERGALDFSLESLHAVDRYLVALHERRRELGGQSLFNTVLWGGAYVGEVIRRVAAAGSEQVVYDTFHWVDYDDYVKAHPEVVRFVGPRDVATYAFLVRTNGAMNVPIGKVQKCITNGIEDSVHFHADCELKAAIRARTFGKMSAAQQQWLQSALKRDPE